MLVQLGFEQEPTLKYTLPAWQLISVHFFPGAVCAEGLELCMDGCNPVVCLWGSLGLAEGLWVSVNRSKANVEELRQES